MEPGPLDPAREARTGPVIPILTIPKRSQGKVTIPLKPPSRLHQTTQVSVHVNRPRILLPRPAEIRRLRGKDVAVLDREPGALVRVFPALRRDGHLLKRQRDAGVYLAVLQDRGAVAEDEVDGAVDVAFTVELAERVRVEGVLVALHAAPEEGRLVRVHPQSHCLVILRPRRVPERHVSRYESLPGHRYNTFMQQKLYYLLSN